MEALSSVSTPPPEDTRQDVGVRRSVRKAGKDSEKRMSRKVYPGSGTKPQVRRSFRTPIQTIPLQVADGRIEKSASRSFALIPDQEDIFTPRANIEGFLAAAEESQSDNATPEVSKRAVTSSAANKIFKIPDQLDGSAAPRLPASSIIVSTPGSKFTPRTNIFSMIHYVDDPEQTPTVRGNDGLNQPSSETSVSTIKHQEWGQEVSISPMYRSRTSEGKVDSPSTLKQAFKRPRRSFHIPASETVVIKASQGAREQISTAEENPVFVHASASENADAIASMGSEEVHESVFHRLDAIVDLEIEAVGASAVSEKLDLFVGTDLTGIHATTLENLDAETLLEKLDVFVETDLGRLSSAMSEKLDAFVSGEGVEDNPDVLEDDLCVAADDTVQVDESENVTHETLAADDTVQADGSENVTHETLAAEKDLTDETNVNNMLGMDEGEGVKDVAEGESSAGQRKWAVSTSSRHQLTTTSELAAGLDAVHGLNKTGHAENVTSNRIGQNVEMLSAGGSVDVVIDADTKNTCGARVETTGENDDPGVEVAEEDADVECEVRKDKSSGGLVGNRTSLTSKHGKISYSLSPKKTPKEAQAASTPSPSVYDLSENSSSSGDVHITRQKSSLHSPRKGRQAGADTSKSSGKRGIGSAKSSKQNISSGRASFSRSKSKLSYSEWKSLQRGKDSTSRTITSFFDTRYPLSSTPSDRTKKIFHSTKIHNAAHANEDSMLEAQMTDSIPNISPIRPVARNQVEKQTGGRHEVTNVDTHGDNQDVAEAGSAGIQHRESGFLNQGEESTYLDEDESNVDFPGFSPLATPHIDMARRTQVSATGQKSIQKQLARRQPSGPGQNPRKEAQETRPPPKKRARTSCDTALPRRSVKFFAERHTTMKLSKDAVEEIEKASEIFWDYTFKALESFALHAGRKTVMEEDVILLMKTQRLIKDTEDLHDAIREFLPMELRSELIPMAKP